MFLNRLFYYKLSSWLLTEAIICMILAALADSKLLDKVRCSKDKFGNHECTCPEDPITETYPDVHDKSCDYFYLCHLGKAAKRKCAPQWAFHPAVKQCMPRNRIPHDLCKPLVECSWRINRYVEDKRDCTKYFLCLYGLYSHWSCPENTFFEPNQEKCLHDKLQAEACITVARKNMMKNAGFEKTPPKTSFALEAARAHRKMRSKNGK